MCDLEHCEHLIRTHEARVGTPFDFVSRLRLDVAWEAELPVPTSLGAPATVHVPHMNAQGGTNDKFVMGTRDAMATYLNRTSYFFRNASWYAWLARSSHGHPFAFDCHGNPGSSSGALRPPSRRRAASRPSTRATSSRPSQPAATPGRALCRCASSQQRPQASSPATVSAAARVAAAALSHRPSPLALRAATPPLPPAGMPCASRPFLDVSQACPKKNGCMVSMNSERFLSFSLWRANVTVAHHQARPPAHSQLPPPTTSSSSAIATAAAAVTVTTTAGVDVLQVWLLARLAAGHGAAPHAR